MYIDEFPDINWVRKNAAQGFVNRKDYNGSKLSSPGWPNVILNAKSSHIERDNIKGPFSLFYNLSGRSLVGLDKKWFQVSDNFYRISNNDQTYNLHIRKGEKAETFNILFGRSLYDEAVQLITHGNERVLQNFDYKNTLAIDLLPKTNFLSYELSFKLLQLHQYRLASQDQYSLDTEYEITASILEHLMIDCIARLKKLESIGSLKPATKKELYKRVNQGLDFIHGNQPLNLDLDSISRHSGLSKFHFIRVFKEIYGQTPTNYIAELKVKKAQLLILKSNKELGDIALELGFSELSAFTRFFKGKTGMTPSSLRISN